MFIKFNFIVKSNKVSFCVCVCVCVHAWAHTQTVVCQGGVGCHVRLQGILPSQGWNSCILHALH